MKLLINLSMFFSSHFSSHSSFLAISANRVLSFSSSILFCLSSSILNSLDWMQIKLDAEPVYQSKKIAKHKELAVLKYKELHG